MRHDDLIGEKPAHDLIEKEAENVAKAAAESIRRRYFLGSNFLKNLIGVSVVESIEM